MLKNIFAIFFMCFSLIGCGALMHASTESELTQLPTEDCVLKEGNSSISGEIFLSTLSGEQKLGAGSTVYILPRCDFSKQFASLTGSNHDISVPRSLASTFPKYSRTVRAKRDGSFQIENLAEGEYYLLSSLTWKTISRVGPFGNADYDIQGGVLGLKISLSSGNKEVLLDNSTRHECNFFNSDTCRNWAN